MLLQLKLLRRLKQKQDYELNASLGYMVSVSKMNKQVCKDLASKQQKDIGQTAPFQKAYSGLTVYLVF